jgi:hypothetical protein
MPFAMVLAILAFFAFQIMAVEAIWVDEPKAMMSSTRVPRPLCLRAYVVKKTARSGSAEPQRAGKL